MIKTSRLLAVLAALGAAFLPGCGSSNPPAPAPSSTLSWALTGLQELGPDFEYEGWLIVNGAPLSTGRFTVDGGGTPSSTSRSKPDPPRPFWENPLHHWPTAPAAG